MATDLRRWRGFGQRLRAARLKSALTLADIGLRSVSTLSRTESGAAAPSEDVVRRYVTLTGDTELIADFLRRLREDPIEAPEAIGPPSFNSLLRLTRLEAIIDVGESVSIIERRTVVAVRPEVGRARLQNFMSPSTVCCRRCSKRARTGRR